MESMTATLSCSSCEETFPFTAGLRTVRVVSDAVFISAADCSIGLPTDQRLQWEASWTEANSAGLLVLDMIVPSSTATDQCNQQHLLVLISCCNTAAKKHSPMLQKLATLDIHCVSEKNV